MGKHSYVGGPMQFKPMMFKGQLYIQFWFFFNLCGFLSGHLKNHVGYGIIVYMTIPQKF